MTVLILGPTVLTPLFCFFSRSVFTQIGNVVTLLGGGLVLAMYIATLNPWYAVGSALACCAGFGFTGQRSSGRKDAEPTPRRERSPTEPYRRSTTCAT